VSDLGATKQKVIGDEAALDAFLETRILIPRSSRCCTHHFRHNSNLLNKEALNKLCSVSQTTEMNFADTSQLIEDLRLRAINNSIFDQFENPVNLNEKLCLKTTGLTCSQFNYLCGELGSMRNSTARSKSQALAVYMFWLKTGLAQDTIAAYFSCSVLTQQVISQYCEQVRDALSTSFVANNLGAKSLRRAELCAHNTPFVREFCENRENHIMSFDRFCKRGHD
jgi:hypothetical protein